MYVDNPHYEMIKGVQISNINKLKEIYKYKNNFNSQIFIYSLQKQLE